MGTPEIKPSSVLPKISRNLAYRTLFLVVVVGSLTYGMEWFLKVRSDLGALATSDTVGWISAVQYLPEGKGQQAVLIFPDGKIHRDPGYVPNTTDRDVTWSPHGNFLYFVSDREEHNFNLFRWTPSSKDPAERRTIGTRSRSNLKFPAQPGPESDSEAKGLLTTGGLVQEFDPTNQSTAQILPPTQKEITQSKSGEEKGTEGQFEGVYGSLGTSFREAQWCGNKRYIAGVMRRETGETLIVQEMQPVDGKFPQPRQLITGEHLEFAVNPKTGDIVYSVQGFQWPDATPPADKDGKPMKKPFINALGVYSFSGKPFILAANKGDIAFGSPAINSDGTAMAVVISKVANGEVTTQGLMTYPTSLDPNFKPLQIPGDIHEPSWSLDGTHILAAVRRPGKPRTIFEIPTDGSSAPRSITGDTGDFGFPHYSPQRKD